MSNLKGSKKAVLKLQNSLLKYLAKCKGSYTHPPSQKILPSLCRNLQNDIQCFHSNQGTITVLKLSKGIFSMQKLY